MLLSLHIEILVMSLMGHCPQMYKKYFNELMIFLTNILTIIKNEKRS
jgi:hypothetical protein